MCIWNKNKKRKKLQSQGIDTSTSPKVSETINTETDNIKPLLNSARFLKIIRKLEAKLSSSSGSTESSKIQENKKIISPVEIPSENSLSSSVEKSLKLSPQALSKKSSIESSYIFPAIAVNEKIEEQISSSKETAPKIPSSFDKNQTTSKFVSSGTPSKMSSISSSSRTRKLSSEKCSKCSQTLHKAKAKKGNKVSTKSSTPSQISNMRTAVLRRLSQNLSENAKQKQIIAYKLGKKFSNVSSPVGYGKSSRLPKLDQKYLNLPKKPKKSKLKPKIKTPTSEEFIPNLKPMESGRFSISALAGRLSPTTKPSKDLRTSPGKPKRKFSPKKEIKSKEKPKQKMSNMATSIPSSKKLISPTKVSRQSSISQDSPDPRNKPRPKSPEDRQNKSPMIINPKLTNNSASSVQYIYQNARRHEIELVDRRDSGSVATKPSKIHPEEPHSAKIYNVFYKSRIFNPARRDRKPKRMETTSKNRHPHSKGVQVIMKELPPSPPPSPGKKINHKIKQTGSQSQGVQKSNRFIDVFKLLEDNKSSGVDIPKSSIIKKNLTSFVRWRGKNSEDPEKPKNSSKKPPKKEVTEGNKKRATKKFSLKKGFLLRRLNTLHRNRNQGAMEDVSQTNSQLSFAHAGTSTSPHNKTHRDQETGSNQFQTATGGEKRIPFADDKSVEISRKKRRKRKHKLNKSTKSNVKA